MLLFEADPFVFLQYRRAGFADDSVPLPDGCWDMADLEAARLPGRISPPRLKGFGKEGPDKIGLEFAGLGLFHFLFDSIEIFHAHMLFDQSIAVQDFFKMLGIQSAFNDLIELGFDFRLFPVANSFDQQVFQGNVLEGFAQDVEDASAKRGSFHLQLVEKSLEDVSFSGFLGDHVPQMADLGLANPVDTAKALFQPVGVPGQVVVDHQVGVLQVDAFASGIGGNQHQNIRIVAELFLQSYGARRD